MELQQKLIRQLKANDQIIQQWSVEEMSATGVLYQQVNQKLQTITQTYNLLSTVELLNKQLEESEVIQQKAERTLNNLDLAQQQFKEIQDLKNQMQQEISHLEQAKLTQMQYESQILQLQNEIEEYNQKSIQKEKDIQIIIQQNNMNTNE
ncbi:Hypothetical_protein [Hexamita inflata]|uniref:Hypothetical_protein n=1 Tax=Hexamita inflata TaxID=28002 RepID=A0AA86TP64_9EUKA|nr:Hypothetical protein HINF_LOCUS10995 [Hexamita inflata]